MEDIPQDPMFQACHFTDCTILIGGNVTDETISKICGETTLREKLGVRDLRKGKGRDKSNWIYHIMSYHVKESRICILSLFLSLNSYLITTNCYFSFYRVPCS